MTGGLEARRDALLAELDGLDGEARWDWLIARARAAPALPESERNEANRVQGCLSNLWIAASFRDGRCWYRCDADSLVVKAITTLLCAFYSDATPAEVLSLDPSFLRDAGITEHLTSHRRNALARVWATLRRFAERHLAAGA